jgi:hypothetical protein
MKRKHFETINKAAAALCLALLFFLSPSLAPSAFCEEGKKWTGVDESVVEKYAKEHGREARRPYIDTDQGDLLLFVFLLAGTAGGFLAGYSWKNLMEKKTSCGDTKKDVPLSRTSKE